MDRFPRGGGSPTLSISPGEASIDGRRLGASGTIGPKSAFLDGSSAAAPVSRGTNDGPSGTSGPDPTRRSGDRGSERSKEAIARSVLVIIRESLYGASGLLL